MTTFFLITLIYTIITYYAFIYLTNGVDTVLLFPYSALSFVILYLIYSDFVLPLVPVVCIMGISYILVSFIVCSIDFE